MKNAVDVINRNALKAINIPRQIYPVILFVLKTIINHNLFLFVAGINHNLFTLSRERFSCTYTMNSAD